MRWFMTFLGQFALVHTLTAILLSLVLAATTTSVHAIHVRRQDPTQTATSPQPQIMPTADPTTPPTPSVSNDPQSPVTNTIIITLSIPPKPSKTNQNGDRLTAMLPPPAPVVRPEERPREDDENNNKGGSVIPIQNGQFVQIAPVDAISSVIRSSSEVRQLQPTSTPARQGSDPTSERDSGRVRLAPVSRGTSTEATCFQAICALGSVAVALLLAVV
ncbi:hypothetical protein HK102_004167 [Quaeritorhiza haematococci]|nr:hypothetical protein HK102_004167 [Quaeritorhiza haematococci]